VPQYDDQLWTVIALAVIVLAGVWANNRGNQNSTTNRAANPAEPEIGRPSSAEFKGTPDESKAENGGSDGYQTERAIRNWTAVLAISGVFAAIFAAFTLNAIRGQLDVMQDDKRPWIRARISLIDPLILSDWNGSKGINVRMNFTLKNYGDAPAVNIRIVPRIAVHPGNARREKITPQQERVCSDAMRASDNNRIGGFAIFPKDEITRPEPVSIFGQTLFKESRQLFSVFGCVDYTYSGNRHGETGYRFLLGQVVNGRVFGVLFQEGVPRPYEEPPSAELLAHGFPITPPNEARVGVDQFYFREEDSGNYAK